jgi:MFS family permease
MDDDGHKVNSRSKTPGPYLVVVLALAYMLSFMDRQILGLMVGPIRQDLGLTDVEVSLLQGMAFAILYGLGSLVVGRIADACNRSLLIAVGIAFWSLMTGACGFAVNFATLFVARAGVGIGESVLSPAAYSMLADAYPPRDLPRAMAGFTIGGILGAGLGFVLGGLVVAYTSQDSTVTVPLVGEVRSWQAVFVLIGLVGIPVGILAATVREPERHGLLRDTEGCRMENVSAKLALSFILARWRGYVPVTLSAAALSILGYGYLGWFPTYLIRVHGINAGPAGVSIGVVYLCFGPIGALSGAKLANYLQKRGYADANLRAVCLIAVGLTVASIGTLAPNGPVALVGSIPVAFLLASYLGLAAAALQLVTPNQMRGRVSALFQLTINLMGLGLGPTIVATLTEHVFRNDLAIGRSLTITVAGAGLIAFALMVLSLGPYRRMLIDASSWARR